MCKETLEVYQKSPNSALLHILLSADAEGIGAVTNLAAFPCEAATSQQRAVGTPSNL